MNRAPHWLRARMGVRVVSALAAAAAVAVVLVVAGVSLVLLLDHQLRQSSEAAATDQATLLGQRISANFTGSGDAKENAIDATGKRSDVVQVITDYGDGSDDPDSRVGSNGPQTDVQVIGSSDTLGSRPRMVDWLLAPGESRTVDSTEITLADGSTEEVTIVGMGFRATGRPITVLAAQQLKPVHQAVDTVSVMVSIGIPILVLVTGFFTYLFAGRALRPVEAMRRRVVGLTDRDLARRVPEPPAQDEVGRLARTMNQMLSRLQDSQATQRRFVADASHELRSPLATVSTGLELLGNGMARDSADLATVQTLRGETGRLTKLVEGLLFLARADERGAAPRREEVDLDELVEGERIRPSADDQVSVTVSTEPVRVVGDRGQLVRVLRNLVDNARRHAGTTVSVSLRPDGDLAVIDVDDDGSGIPEADRTRVFERFVRLDEARARGDGGSGLGLAIVAELVLAHGGTVTAGEAETLGGARFRITVPLSGAPGSLDVGEPEPPSAPAAVAVAEETGTGADRSARAGPARAVEIPGQAEHDDAPRAPVARPSGAGANAGAGEPSGAPGDARRGSDLFSPVAPSAPAGPVRQDPGPVASAPTSGQTTTGGAGPALFDDRPSGPFSRVPMGGRRRGPGVEPSSPDAGADGTTADARGDRTTAEAGGHGTMGELCLI
ncbi:MAG: ATP-binding protein, partial [Pseudonocardia sp.]|nr:ATP-binding protein [Pseudonocardia sp.]